MDSPTITLDSGMLQELINKAVEEKIISAVEYLSQDPTWLEKVEKQINQAVVQRTVAGLSAIDINSVIHGRVDENMKQAQNRLMKNFVTTGISDQASQLQLTVMDEATVVENCLTASSLNIVGTAQVQNLTVKGSINTDNRSWVALAENISEKTLEKINDKWSKVLVDQITEQITTHGISFDTVKIGDSLLVNGNTLSSQITETNIKQLGTLTELQVSGPCNMYNTLSVTNQRVGINTNSPEMALSVWDEEVSLVLGKNKSKQAYIGTNRDQSLVIGVNRVAQIEIDTEGLTTVKKLRVGLHRISHDSQVPGWSGTRGDLVFNSSPGPDRVFAWVCLGAYKWQALKSAE